jgi:broad specificity phosphatase PhoE
MINQKYLQLNQIQITKRFFEDNRFILPKCPESQSEITKRISAFTKTMMDICIEKVDFKRYPIICVTHQGVLEVIKINFNDFRKQYNF